MTTEQQSVPLPLGRGIDEGVGSKRLRLPQLAAADNVRLDKEGVYRKSDGTESLGAVGVSSTAEPCGLVENRGQIAQVTTEGLYRYNSTGGWSKPNTSTLYPCLVETAKTFSSGSLPRNPDAAFLSSGLGCVVWEEGEEGQCYALFVDSDGAVIRGPVSLGANMGYRPRVVAVNNEFVAYAYASDPDVGGSDVYSAEYDGSYGWNTPVSLSFSIQHFDVHANETESVVYWVSSNLTRSLNPDGTTANNNALSNAQSPRIYHDATAQRVIVAYNNSSSGDIEVVFRSEDLATTHTGPVTLLASASKPSWINANRGFLRPHGASNYAVALSDDSSPGIVFIEFNASGSPVNAREYKNACLAGRGHWDAEYGLVFAIHDSLQVPTVSGTAASGNTISGTGGNIWTGYRGAFLVQDTDDGDGNDAFLYLARLQDNPSRDEEFDHKQTTPSIVGLGSNRWLVPMTRVVRDVWEVPSSTRTDRITRVDLHVIDTQATALSAAPAADGTVVAGGFVGFFDRQRAVENSVHGAPEIGGVGWDSTGATFTPQGDGGSYTAAKAAIDLTVVCRWVDSTGRIHRSPPSNVAVFVFNGRIDDNYVSAAADLELHVLPPQSAVNGEDLNQLTYEVYGWSYNDLEGSPMSATSGIGAFNIGYGTQRYLIHTQTDPATSTLDDRFVVLSTGSLNISQTNIAASIPEYVQAGERASEPTEPARSVASDARRVYYLSADGSYVGYSKPLGRVYAAEFSAEQRINVPGGDGVAIEIMDDYLVVLTETGVYVTGVSGGPDATGAGGAFAPLRRVPSDGGCTERRSVVSTPAGVLFRGRRGLNLVDRSTSVSFVGSAARDSTATVQGAVVNAAQSEAIFLTGSNAAVAFDYERGEWFTRSGLPDTDLIVVDGLVHYLASDRVVHRQTPGVYTTSSGSGYFLVTLETPWIALSGPGGSQRIEAFEIIGQHFGGDLRLRMYLDYDTSTVVEEKTYEEARLAAENGIIRYEPKKQKCMAMKLQLVEQQDLGEPSTTNLGGYWLEDLQVEVRGKRGNRVLGATTPTAAP